MSGVSSKLPLVPPPGGNWGIIVSVLVVGLAVYCPTILLMPAAQQFLPLVPLSTNLKVAIMTTAVATVAAGIVLLALAAHGKKFTDIGLARPKLGYAGKAFLGLLVYIALSLSVQTIARQFLGLNTEEPQDLSFTQVADFEMVVAFMTLVLVIPFVEELMFRGFMFKGFRSRLPFWLAAIGVSALFGYVHGQWNVGLDVFVMSMVACYLVEKTKSLWPAIFLHMFKNAIAFYLVYLYNGA